MCPHERITVTLPKEQWAALCGTAGFAVALIRGMPLIDAAIELTQLHKMDIDTPAMKAINLILTKIQLKKEGS